MSKCKNGCGQPGKPKFCSKSCAATYNNFKYPKRTVQPRYCKTCNTPIPFKYANYCGAACRPASDRVKREKATYTCKCKTCKGAFTASASTTIYCSLDCKKKYLWSSSLKAIKATKAFSGGVEAKRYLKYKNGHKCTTCNRKTWNNKPIPLVLDHIDGNSDNWYTKNLRLICCNCDAQTPTYKSKNKGNGRKSRLAKYHEDKDLYKRNAEGVEFLHLQ